MQPLKPARRGIRRALAALAAAALAPAAACDADAYPDPAAHGLGPVVVSSDGAWVLAVCAPERSLLLLDRERRVVRRHALADLARRATSRVAAAHDAPRRRSFVVALRDLPELWEIPYHPDAEPIHDGLVHDHRLGEAIASPGHLGVRRTRLAAPLVDVVPGDDSARWIGVGCAGPDGRAPRWVIHLDVRRPIGELAPLEGQAACSR